MLDAGEDAAAADNDADSEAVNGEGKRVMSRGDLKNGIIERVILFEG